MIKTDRSVAGWLFMCAAAVFLMALLGAVTRLTESGLSMVEWKPVAGTLPPMNDTGWNREFSLYQQSPQYKKVNAGMSLEDFKKIYFWEWLHRLWGRMIGVIFFAPLAWFWMRRRISDAAKKPLLGILALGFLQGAMGWLMVKSGLVDQPAVSHYRLAAHLALAVVIFCCLFRMGLVFSIVSDPAVDKASSLRRLVWAAVIITGITMIWGAFVAGLRAGVVYNDNFPMMGEHLWPGEIFDLSPLWINFFENHAAVQFAHRALALLTFCLLMVLGFKGVSLKGRPRMSRTFVALLAMGCLQVALGITTLLTQVNIVAATLHQAGAFMVLALLLLLLHDIPRKGASHAV